MQGFFFVESKTIALRCVLFTSISLNINIIKDFHQTLIIENPPPLDIQYPLTSSSTWTYGASVEGYGQIDKSVDGAEALNLMG